MEPSPLATPVPAHLQALVDAAVAAAHEADASPPDLGPLYEWLENADNDIDFDYGDYATWFHLGEGSGLRGEWVDSEVEEEPVTDAVRLEHARGCIEWINETGGESGAATACLLSTDGRTAVVGFLYNEYFNHDREFGWTGIFPTEEAFKADLVASEIYLEEQITDQMILDRWQTPKKKRAKPQNPKPR